MAQQNFKLVTPVQSLERQVFELADRTLLNPNNANPLVMGEWLELDAAYKLIRGSGSALAFPMFDEMGRSDTQAIGKVTCLITSGFIADTYVFNGGAAPALSAKLEVATVTNTGPATNLTNKSGLQTLAAGEEVGRVMRTAATNGGYLRFYATLA